MKLKHGKFLGAVIRIKDRGRWRILLAIRTHETVTKEICWTNFAQIKDQNRTYAKLPIDVIALVQVESKAESIRLCDLFTVTLTKNGDTTNARAALNEGRMVEILDTALESEGLLLSAKGR